MDAAQGQGVYPQHRCNTIHLVRHAQGFHNVAGEKDHSAYKSPVLFDAELTPLGWQQGVHWCDKRRSITEYKPFFPAIDFSLIESDDDVFWDPDVREPDADLAARGMKCFEWFNNCELRTVVIADRSMMGKSSSSTDFPGKIPQGLDAPSDDAEENP